MTPRLQVELDAFVASNPQFRDKGALCVAIVVTELALGGLPLDPDELLTGRSGQVKDLGRAQVQKVLRRHEIDQVLAREGGRTSRGSINNMRLYVAFLNKLNADRDDDDAPMPVQVLVVVENFWVERVREYFAAQPLIIRLNPAWGLRTVVRNVLAQARKREQTASGMHYSGAVLQYLVGAKLRWALGEQAVTHHSSSASDSQTGRPGDFLIGDVAIHVTMTPSDALIERCQENVDSGLRPIVVTAGRGVATVEGLAESAGLGEKIDVFEVEQFIALNLYEIGKFSSIEMKATIKDFVDIYNKIVEAVDTDPGLKLSFH
jgi:hypothetical protein